MISSPICLPLLFEDYNADDVAGLLLIYARIIGISTFFSPSFSPFSTPATAGVGSVDAAVYCVFSL